MCERANNACAWERVPFANVVSRVFSSSLSDLNINAFNEILNSPPEKNASRVREMKRNEMPK